MGGTLAKKVTTPFKREEKEIIMTVKETHGCIHESMGKGVDGAKVAQHMIRQNRNRCRVQTRTQPSPTGKPKTRSVTRKENQHRQQYCRQKWGRDKGWKWTQSSIPIRINHDPQMLRTGGKTVTGRRQQRRDRYKQENWMSGKCTSQQCRIKSHNIG